MNKKLLSSILHIESESGNCAMMESFILAHAEAMGYDWERDIEGNLYLVKGDGPYPCMVAHMDTVHKITGHGITLITVGDLVTGLDAVEMQQTGIGGDDKCGIYAALHCMDSLPSCKAVFFVDEEVGCMGSYNCDLDFFADCRFILQADRRGSSDFVTDIFGPLSSKRFRNAVSPILRAHGFKESNGAMSDVMALRDDEVGISVANISAGYYNPHLRCEYIHLGHLENTVSLMETIGLQLTEDYPFTYRKPREDWSKFLPPSAKTKGERFPDWEKDSFGGRIMEWPEEEEEEMDEDELAALEMQREYERLMK